MMSNKKKIYIIITIILFLLEAFFGYIVLEKYLNNDYITPNKLTFYQHLMNKFTNFV